MLKLILNLDLFSHYNHDNSERIVRTVVNNFSYELIHLLSSDFLFVQFKFLGEKIAFSYSSICNFYHLLFKIEI